MERITGPVRGYYIATYACEGGSPDAPWFGYSKLCRAKPESYWDANGCAKVRSFNSHPTPGGAMADAEREAREQAINMRPTDYARTLFAAAVR